MSWRNTEIARNIAIWELSEARVQTDFTPEKKHHLIECSECISLNTSGICHELRTSRTKTQLAPRQFGPRVARQFATYCKAVSTILKTSHPILSAPYF